jgi:hypothetical protein
VDLKKRPLPTTEQTETSTESYFNADKIWMQNLFQDCSWILRMFFLVFRRNCFSEPDDMYSVMKISCNRDRFDESQFGPESLKKIILEF